MGERSFEWFVRPLDAATNKIIADYLLAHGSLDENLSMPTIDGEEVDVLRLKKYSDVAYLNRSIVSLNLKFKVYARSSSRGRIYEFNFPKKKKKKGVAIVTK